MAEIKTKFYGQHGDEKILSEIRLHPYAIISRYIKVGLAAAIILIATIMIASQVPTASGMVMGLGWPLTLVVAGLGFWVVWASEQKTVGYITDRRIIRFSATTPFTVNSRALPWDEAVKVKTYAPNFLWRMFNIGNVVVHAKSTVISTESPKDLNLITDDDVVLSDVYYYRDLGNYIDKILYLNRSDRSKIMEMKPFVRKPKGKRY